MSRLLSIICLAPAVVMGLVVMIGPFTPRSTPPWLVAWRQQWQRDFTFEAAVESNNATHTYELPAGSSFDIEYARGMRRMANERDTFGTKSLPWGLCYTKIRFEGEQGAVVDVPWKCERNGIAPVISHARFRLPVRFSIRFDPQIASLLEPGEAPSFYVSVRLP